MAFEKVIIFISLLLVSSVYPYSLDISASLRWGEVRDNMLCFLRLSEQNIGGVINARRGTGDKVCKTYCSSNTTTREVMYNSPDFSDCGFFQTCISGRCTLLSNLTTRAQTSTDISTGLAALQRLYLSSVFPSDLAIYSALENINSGALAALLSQSTGSALPVLATISSGSADRGLASAISSVGGNSGFGAAGSIPRFGAALGPLQPPSGAFSVASSPIGILPALLATSQTGGGLGGAGAGAAGAGSSINPQDISNGISALGSMASSGAELATGGARLGTSIANLVNAANGQAGK